MFFNSLKSRALTEKSVIVCSGCSIPLEISNQITNFKKATIWLPQRGNEGMQLSRLGWKKQEDNAGCKLERVISITGLPKVWFYFS